MKNCNLTSFVVLVSALTLTGCFTTNPGKTTGNTTEVQNSFVEAVKDDGYVVSKSAGSDYVPGTIFTIVETEDGNKVRQYSGEVWEQRHYR